MQMPQVGGLSRHLWPAQASTSHASAASDLVRTLAAQQTACDDAKVGLDVCLGNLAACRRVRCIDSSFALVILGGGSSSSSIHTSCRLRSSKAALQKCKTDLLQLQRKQMPPSSACAALEAGKEHHSGKRAFASGLLADMLRLLPRTLPATVHVLLLVVHVLDGLAVGGTQCLVKHLCSASRVMRQRRMGHAITSSNAQPQQMLSPHGISIVILSRNASSPPPSLAAPPPPQRT